METSTNEVPEFASSSNPPSQLPSPQSPLPSTCKMSPTYPPLLPPPNFFDLELEAEKLKDMFKASNSLKNPLFDETGLLNLPVDARGVLILDPESKTRMVDVEVELDCLYEYLGWIGSAKSEVEEGTDDGREEKVKWLEGLRKEVDRDMGEVFDEWHAVVDEEREKRGLTDRWTHWAHFKGQERKGHGEHGEWVVRKARKAEKYIENVAEVAAEVAEQIVLEEMLEDVSVSGQPGVRRSGPESARHHVSEAESDVTWDNVALPVGVEDTKRKDHVLEHPKAPLAQAEEVPEITLAESTCIPPSSTEDPSLLPPALELIDLWW